VRGYTKTAENRSGPCQSKIHTGFAKASLFKIKTEASSYAEVLKNALRLYEALIDETERGNEFLIRNEDGMITPYRMFLT
jgi:hypothetical protein